jgi:CheY-like chemotaxis protein
MNKPVLSVGQCGPDHGTLSRFLLNHFGVQVVPVPLLDEGVLSRIRSGEFSLVLVNRKLDADYSCGMTVLKKICSDPAGSKTPVMLVTNYVEHQEKAVSLGGVYGFGKLEYDKPETLARLEGILGPRLSAAATM